MNDIERMWKYGRTYKAIWDEGQKLKKWLDAHPGHSIKLTKKKTDEEEENGELHDHDHG